MLNQAQIEVLQNISTDFNNPYFQNYLKSETTPKHRCPICEKPFENYINFKYHIVSNHPDSLDDENVQNVLNPLNRVRLACGMRKDTELLTIGKFFGDIITSTHNQNALVNIIGKQGMGKSNASMYIGLSVADYVAKKMGGKQSDYFSIDNCAIMKLDSIIPIMEDIDKKRYNVIILDDIGASYGARDFQNVVNKNLNKIFQTFRDTNTLVIMTVPDTFLMDKVGRKLAHYQIELVEKRHDQNVSIGKLVQLVEQYRSGKTHFHFIVDKNGVKYPRVIFKRVPKEFADQYEKKRSEIRQSMQNESIQAIIKSETEGDGKETKSLNDLPAYQKIAAEVDIELTINPGISCRALGQKLNVSKDTADKARKYVLELRKAKAERDGGVNSLI